jgi:hypothetical protein
MKQLFANNAKTTLTASISSTDVALQVLDGSIFPNPGANEYFLATLEIGNQIEIVRITSVVGTNMYMTSVADRAQEGTTAFAFPAGTRVEVRVTKGTLDLYSKALLPLASVAQLIAPKDALNTGYICANLDAYGNPAIAVTKDDFTWRFINYTVIQSLASTTGNTTTTLNCAGTVTSGTSLGKYLMQITSGPYAGYVREISSYTGTSISWTTVLGGAPADGTTFEILQSNASILIDTLAISDDAVVMPLILGGN